MQQDERLIDWLTRHRGLLLKVTRSFARSSHDQGDLFQEIALQVWKSIPAYRPVVKETTWIYRVALYTAISWNRKERRRTESIQELDLERILADKSADASADTDPRVEWLYDKIAAMEPVDRSLALLLLDGFSYREMAEALGISEGNVGVRINRIKKRLAAQLKREDNDDI